MVHFHVFSLLFNFGISKQIWILNVISNMILLWNRCYELYLYQNKACKTSNLKKKRLKTVLWNDCFDWKSVEKPLFQLSQHSVFLYILHTAWQFIHKSCVKEWRYNARWYFFQNANTNPTPQKAFFFKNNQKSSFLCIYNKTLIP